MKKRGYTLLELIATLAISSLIFITLGLIFNISLKVNQNTYKEELYSKEATICMLYIENVINKAYKIEKVDNNSECNFKLYLRDDKGDMASYTFGTDFSNLDKQRYLYAYIDNYRNSDSRAGKVRIAMCSRLNLIYNEGTNSIKIIINADKPEFSYQSTIYLGHIL